MTAKELTLPDIGKIRIAKRRRARSISIRLHPDGLVRVTLPMWVPYRVGLEFAKSRRNWILNHQKPKRMLKQNELIGKQHNLQFVNSQKVSNPVGRMKNGIILISIPLYMTFDDVSAQDTAKTTCLRAIKKEADNILPTRLHQLAAKHDFSFNSVKTRRLTARWGSCSSKQDIVLNTFLVNLPWELIDYVILHELVHTKVQNHSPAFWLEFEKYSKQPKLMRKALRQYQSNF